MTRQSIHRSLYIVAAMTLALVSGATARAATHTSNANTQRASGPLTFEVVFGRNFTLQPGVAHGFVLGKAEISRGFVPEVTPLSPSDFIGASITSFVHPEFDGVRWIDVLRVILNGGSLSVEANLRVYSIV